MTRGFVLALTLGSAAALAQTKSPEELERIRRAIKADTAAWGRPTLSLAPAETVTEPETVAPLAGAVIDTVGGAVSEPELLT